MHFRYAKIMVATSVCTGDRHCPPDSAIEMGSNPANKTDLAKDYHKGNPWLNGPDDRIRYAFSLCENYGSHQCLHW